LNENDKTVMQVKLDRPILPNETIELYIFDFKAKLPRFLPEQVLQRLLFSGKWFPSTGVYESAGEVAHEKTPTT
jgi:hypothetical protein